MEFRTATQADFDYLADHSVSRGIQKHCPEQIDYVYALEHEGVVLGVGGFKMINVTTMWVWCDLSDKASSYITMVYRTLKEWLDIFVENHGIIRAQAYVEANFVEGIHMIEHLGFKREFPMPRFVGNETAFMYSKFYGEVDDILCKQE